MPLDTWLPFFYHYGVGGLLFTLSLIVAVRTGAVRWSRPRDRRLVWTLVAGMVGFGLIRAVWIALATA